VTTTITLLGIIVVIISAGVIPASAGVSSKAAPSLGIATSRYPASRLTTHHQHTCIVLADGSMRCWGDNTFGQLGNQTTGGFSDVPVNVRFLLDANAPLNAVAAAAGETHTCFLQASGRVFCFGSNAQGQLGVSRNLVGINVPFGVNTSTGLTNVVALAAGSEATCAIRADGRVFCWGDNAEGKLGNGSSGGVSDVPVAVDTSTGLTNAVAVGVGRNHACALRADGRVFCWGARSSGQLGDGANVGFSAVPVAVDTSTALGNAIALAVGHDHTCALAADGGVLCWGSNGGGQLGRNTLGEVISAVPIEVDTTSGLTRVVAITAGFLHTCGLRADGRALCWGSNDLGQLGNGTVNFAANFVPSEVSGLRSIVALTAGSTHTCGLRADGRAFCWGGSSEGRVLGNSGAPEPRALASSEVFGVAGSISATTVVAGSVYTCALRANGTAACWGDNAVGQVGSGTTTTPQVSPVSVLRDTGNPAIREVLSNLVALAAGGSHTCALRADGEVLCWGLDDVGQLGSGGSGPGGFRRAATRVVVDKELVRPLTNVVGLAAGGSHTCALRANGEVFCWGFNESGELGIGSSGGTIGVAVPVDDLTGLTNAVALAATGSNTCALRGDGQVFCWGDNGQGQLGIGSSGGSSNVPTPVSTASGLTNVVSITAGLASFCALRADGAVFCWGLNTAGQLGIGSSGGFRDTPTQVRTDTGLSSAVGLEGGGSHTCALRADGVAFCWGFNSAGQLGLGSSGGLVSSPIAVSAGNGLANAIAVTGGGSHTCALRADGAPFCWGRNAEGQLGLGSTLSPRTFPFEVPSFRFNIDPDVRLQRPGRIAVVTVIVNCPAGGHVKILVSLTQGNVSGAAQASGVCTGDLTEVSVKLPAHGRAGFQPGAAQAEAEANVSDRGRIIDLQQWTREVELTFVP